jgi:hypothetical protein
VSWSYSGDPGASDLDEVRFLIGDTDTDDQQLSDEEINYLLTSTGSVQAAALGAARSLWAKYSRMVDQKTGDIDIKYSQRRDNYAALIKQLQIGMLPVPYAGGISEDDKQVDEADSDVVQPAFTRGMMEYDGTDSEDQNDV